MDRYAIPVRNGRSVSLSAAQLRRIATGLGCSNQEVFEGDPPAIIRAIMSLPAAERAEAVQVIQLRFAEKLDVESISHNCGLNPWEVWRLESAFLAALDDQAAAAGQLPETVVV